MKIYNSKLLMTLLAGSTIIGLSLHDTKLDTMTQFVIALPIALATYEGANVALQMSESHTHVERVSMSEVFHRATSLNPWLQVRQHQNKHYRATRTGLRSNQPFDDYMLPVRL